MGFLKWAIAGTVGGAVGAAIWAAIAHYAHAEVGYVAWGIGFLVGLCVRLAAADEEGVGPGITAVSIACLAIVIGKFAAASMMVSDIGTGSMPTITADHIMMSFAHKMVEEYEAQGTKLNWPPNMDAKSAEKLDDYPSDIRQAASKKWGDLTPREQTKQIAGRQKEVEAFQKMLSGVIQQQAFRHSFGPYDILWFILAALTSFRIGSGASSDD